MQSPPLLTAKEEITRVNKRIKAGEKEAEEIKNRVQEQKKTLAKLEKELSKIKEGERFMGEVPATSLWE